MIIAIGITGIRVTNRGQWMSDKWSIKKQERLSKNIYMHIVVKIQTNKEILAQ